jgi:NADH:quinone reductase (non-electrogenic)
VMVTAIDELGVTIQSANGEERIPTRTVIWAAGVRPSGFSKVLVDRAGAQLTGDGHVMVDAMLNIPGHPEIFVIGDMAHVLHDGIPLPGVAPAAIQEGRYVARSIVQRVRCQAVKPFRYFYKGSLAVIGRKAGVAEFGPVKFGGVFAWLTWLFVHLLFLVHFRSKLIVMMRWGIEYFTFDRGSRIITGDARLQPSPQLEETVKRT